MKNENLVITAGFAEVPKGTTLYNMYKMIGCVIIINTENLTIHDISFTFVMNTTSDFIAQLLRGISIQDGLDEAIEIIQKKVFIPGQGALIHSLKQAYDRYCESLPC